MADAVHSFFFINTFHRIFNKPFLPNAMREHIENKNCEDEFNYFCLHIYYVTYNRYNFVKLQNIMFPKMFSVTLVLLKLSQVKFRRLSQKFNNLPKLLN